MDRLIALLLLAVVGLAAQTRIISHVTRVDAGAPQEVNIVIENGKIRDIGPPSRVQAPSGAQTLDMTGKFVVPAIINLHGHVGNVKGLEQDRKHFTRENVQRVLHTYAMYGVSLTTSMGTDEDLMIEIRDARNRGAFHGAHVMTALQGFTARGGYPTTAPGVKGVAQEVVSASQAEAWVDKLADKGADLVKMWVDSHHGEFDKLSPEIYSAIIKRAKKHNLPTLAHIYELSDAKSLIKAGVNIIGHSVRDHEVDDELIRLLKANNVYYSATLSREKSTYVYHDPPVWLDDPFFKQGIDAGTIREVRTELKEAQSDPKIIEQGRQDFEMGARNVKKLFDAGVNVAFGTDTGPPGRFAGYFEHWEAELMVAAGIPPAKVINSWSKMSARALRIEKQRGTLEKGLAADLIILDANPLDDIRNTRKIHAVYIDGKAVE